METIQDHIEYCEKLRKDLKPDEVRCKYCKIKLKKVDLKDHAIAHTLYKKQIERHKIMKIVH